MSVGDEATAVPEYKASVAVGAAGTGGARPPAPLVSASAGGRATGGDGRGCCRCSTSSANSSVLDLIGVGAGGMEAGRGFPSDGATRSVEPDGDRTISTTAPFGSGSSASMSRSAGLARRRSSSVTLYAVAMLRRVSSLPFARIGDGCCCGLLDSSRRLTVKPVGNGAFSSTCASKGLSSRSVATGTL